MIMLYSKFEEILTACPFCVIDDRWLLSNSQARLTYSLAPYVKYHLLVTPKRHVKHVSKLTQKELRSIFALLSEGIQILHAKKIHDYTILVRNGHVGNTVEHVHFHLIPKHRIGDLEIYAEEREILTKRQIASLTKELSAIIKKLA